MRIIPQIAFDEMDRLERCVLRVYDDARPNYVLQPTDKPIGTLTAGRGHTGFVFIGDPVSQARADQWTWDDLQTALSELYGKIGDAIYALTENQFAALLLFVVNCGTGHPDKPEWNIWKVLRAKSFPQVPLELAKFVNGKVNGVTVKIKGLVNRRNAEIALWSTDEPGSVDIEMPSSMTRAMVTPPTPSDPVPASKSHTIISGAVAAATSLPVAYNQVSTALAPLAHTATHAAVVAAVACAGALSAAACVAFAVIHKRNARN